LKKNWLVNKTKPIPYATILQIVPTVRVVTVEIVDFVVTADFRHKKRSKQSTEYL
jgi:hypothetical protein